ncbi:MAG: polyamine ABC transporter substrate-binding protein [Bacillota bacterium]
MNVRLRRVLLVGIVVLFVAAAGLGCAKDKPKDQASSAPAPQAPVLAKTLNVYNWSDYLPEDIIREFEQEFGVKVNYDTYASNEELLAKLQMGASGYDLVFPSDYMVEIMVQLNLLEPLNHNNIPNAKHLDPNFLNLPFDQGNKYSLPYLWGTTGLAVNTAKVAEEITSWEELWNPKYKGKIALLNDSRETLGLVLKTLGYSLNTTNQEELQNAKKKLHSLLPSIKAFDSENMKNMMVSGEVWLAHAYVGDVMMAAEENEDLVYVLPKEGGVIWADNLAIPKGAPHKYTAEVFINFLLRPEISARIAEEILYGTPNAAAKELIDPEIAGNPAIYPPEEILAKCEWLQDVGEATKLYDRIWTEVKGY